VTAIARGHAIYDGVVWHHRRAPEHKFRQTDSMAWIDLDRLDDLYGRSWLLTRHRWSPVAFRRADHHGDPAVPLADAVRARVALELGIDAPGPVFLLAHLRTLGHCFNPIAVYWCTDQHGEPVAELLEVTNTPWHERHTYVLDRRAPAAGGPVEPLRFPKAMHVSPFLPMDLDYTLEDAPPEARVSLTLRVSRGDDVVFDAGLVARRHVLDHAALRRLLLRRPTQRVVLGIHLQALRLWRKGTRFLPHPARIARRPAPTDVRTDDIRTEATR
jgi:DUF1365 family protein